ncbi:MAG: hypothetical protein AAF447_19990, partial [Myxococcota bacterium]
LAASLDPLSDETVAVWLRAEAVLFEEDLEESVRLSATGAAGRERLSVEVDAARAPELLGLIGRKLGPLAEDQGRGPRSAERERREPPAPGRRGGREPGSERS